MTEEIVPGQDTATLALMMDREIDKRVMIALSRALNPGNTWEVREIERAYENPYTSDTQNVVRNMLINAIMSDGSLMHLIRSKLAEQLNKY